MLIDKFIEIPHGPDLAESPKGNQENVVEEQRTTREEHGKDTRGVQCTST